MTQRTNRWRYGLLSTGVIALAVSTTGCTMDQPDPTNPSTSPSQAADQLRSLPSFEDTEAQLRSAIDQIATAATQKVPDIVWQSATNADSGSCPAPFDQSDGQSAYLPNRIAENISVSEQDWTSLLQIAKDAAAKLGATDVQVMQDQPGKHDVWFSGPAGLFLKYSYKGNMVISGYTGCRLPTNNTKPQS